MRRHLSLAPDQLAYIINHAEDWLIFVGASLGIPGERERDSGMMPNANPG
jgi:hypothetical protein